MHCIINRIVATSATSVKVSVALDLESATKLVSNGFPAFFTAWGNASDLVVGKKFDSFSVLNVRAAREDKDDKGNPITYPAETQLMLVG